MRKIEAVWIEDRQCWQINVQYGGKRKTFICSTPGSKGKVAAERKSGKWLENPSSAETMRVETLLDEYENYLETTKTKTYSGQYKGFIRLYIQSVINYKRIAKLTEGDLQDIIDNAYAKSMLSDKTLRDIRTCTVSFVALKTRMMLTKVKLPSEGQLTCMMKLLRTKTITRGEHLL